ncbi:MAG TPA: hypothetical protein VHA53_09780 [Nitrolancea sp.]|nr:hypothetical protein [Nitrolancea sp.]
MAIVVVVAGLIVLVIVLLTQFVLAEAPIRRPVAPPAVAALRTEWQSPILLPNFLPACLTYDPLGARIDLEPDALGGKALVVGLIAPGTPTCRDAANANVVITQAPALQSLHGEVTTITEGRMQFARVARAGANGQNDVTLQWHCRINIMCRLSGTIGSVITEDTLAKMANSFEIIRPAP